MDALCLGVLRYYFPLCWDDELVITEECVHLLVAHLVIAELERLACLPLVGDPFVVDDLKAESDRSEDFRNSRRVVDGRHDQYRCVGALGWLQSRQHFYDFELLQLCCLIVGQGRLGALPDYWALI